MELVEKTAHRLGTFFGLPNHFHLIQCVMHGGKCSVPISLDIEKLILGKYSQFYNYCQNH